MLGKQKATVIILCVSLTLCAASYVAGRVHQYQKCLDWKEQMELDAYRHAEKIQTKLVETERQLKLKQQKLEEAAHAEPETSSACLPASRVRRLNLR